MGSGAEYDTLSLLGELVYDQQETFVIRVESGRCYLVPAE